MEQNDIDEILDYINEKFDANIPSFVKMLIGKKIHIKFDQKEILLNLNVNIYSNILNQEFKVIANNVEVKFLENLDNFTDSEWQNLYKLSENTFVEESESLKQGGAGAGLTDND